MRLGLKRTRILFGNFRLFCFGKQFGDAPLPHALIFFARNRNIAEIDDIIVKRH